MHRRIRPRYRLRSREPGGQHYDSGFLVPDDRAEIVAWLSTLHPIWENRYPDEGPFPEGQSQRPLLRPVYWLGSWQFACLDYYRPPHGTQDRCVLAEPFPRVLAHQVKRI